VCASSLRPSHMVTPTKNLRIRSKQQHVASPDPYTGGHPPANRMVKLPPFCATNLRSWFTSAEGAFQLRNIADEESRTPGFTTACMLSLRQQSASLQTWWRPIRSWQTRTRSFAVEVWLRIRRRIFSGWSSSSASRPSLHGSRRSSLQRCYASVPGARRTSPSSPAYSSTSCPGSPTSCFRRRTWWTSRRWPPERTCLSPTTASTLTCWWRWPPALSRSKERSPQWRRCTLHGASRGQRNSGGRQRGGSGRGKKKHGDGGGGGLGL
jgi:hypothetical protein